MSDWLHGVQVPGIKIMDLRRFAEVIRRGANIDVGQAFPVLPFLEHAMPAALSGFDFEVTDDLPENVEACAYPDGCPENPNGPLIKLSPAVYSGAHNGIGRHRLTVLHEIAHVILHRQVAVHPRGSYQATIPAYKNSEWQATQLAVELLMPVGTFVDGEQLNDFCARLGVSRSAAQVRARRLISSGDIAPRTNWPSFISTPPIRRVTMTAYK